MPDPTVNMPEWVQTLQWIGVAVLLAIAYVGPKIFGPIIERWKNAMPSSALGTRPMPLAIAGAVLADKDAILRLSEALNRLCDVLEDRIAREEEQNEEAKTRETFRRLLKELTDAEKADRERK